MSSFTTQLRAFANRFRRDESGLAALESILLIPLLFWAYIATFVMFDAYKKQTDGRRATYAVADTISREENAISQSYLNAMLDLTNFMTRRPNRVTQRVTLACYSPKKEKYRVAWSRIRARRRTSTSGTETRPSTASRTSCRSCRLAIS